MSERAKVGSLEAIEAFRASLVVYIAQARAALEEVSSDAIRVRLWIENDQRRFWEAEARRRQRQMEEAQQALFSARLSRFSTGVSLEQLAMQRARRAVEAADQKLHTLKRWDRDFDGVVQPLVKQMEKLHTMLSNDLIKGVAELDRMIETLSEYSRSGAAPQAAPAQQAAGQTAQGGDQPAGSGPLPQDKEKPEIK